MPLPPAIPTSDRPRGWPIRGAIVAVVLFSFFAGSEAVEAHILPALFPSQTPDFFILRTGAVFALRGESPYEPQKVQAMVAEQFPTDAELIANSAFFPPPGAIPLSVPLAAIPYPLAKAAWAVILTLSAAGLLLVFRIFGTDWPTTTLEQLLPAILLLNYLTLVIVELGQTSLLFGGCVATGQWCFERGGKLTGNSRWWPTAFELLGAFLWSIPFIKPHLALPLLPLAWFLGGWKRLAAIAAILVAMNLAGCWMIGRSPLYLWDYVQYLGSTHKKVSFNRVESSAIILSWNRLLYGAGGPLIELNAYTTLASYLVWFGLVLARVAISGRRPSAPWAAAAAAVGGVFCAQVLVYEVLFLVLVIPWARTLFASGYRNQGWLIIGLLVLQLIPIGTMYQYGITYHHALGVALLAVLVLWGPVRDDRL